MVLERLDIATASFAIISRDHQAGLVARTSQRVNLATETSRHGPKLRNYPLFTKPIGDCTSKGISISSKIGRPDDLIPAIDQLEAVYGGQDILLETFLSGREITVGINGTGQDSKVIGANEYVYKDRRTFGSRRISDCMILQAVMSKTHPWMARGIWTWSQRTCQIPRSIMRASLL